MPILAHLAANYPHLHAAWTQHATLLPGNAATPLQARPLGQRLQQELGPYGFSELAEVDAALGRIGGAGSIVEQQRFLVSTQMSQFITGQEEVLAIDQYHNAGVLDAIGFPPGAGGSPPFDCSLLAPVGGTIANDIKTAGSTAMMLLYDALDQGTAAWKVTNGVAKANYKLTWSGPVTQKLVRTHQGAIQTGWVSHLAVSGPALPTPVFKIQIGGTSLEVHLKAGGGLGGGMASIKSHALVALDTLETHVTKKAKHGHPFVLTYVRRFGHPMADMQPEPFRSALTTLHHRLSLKKGVAHQRWLGAVYLDFTKGVPAAHSYARHKAGWPDPKDPYRFAQHIGAQAWVTRRR